MTDRALLLEQIGGIQVRLLASTLPEETSSLLDYDLTLQQIRVFAFVFASGETPISKVADALRIKPNVATGIVQRLVERGLIERREDATDRRVRLLTVTDGGRALIDELGNIILAKQLEVLGRLDDRQLAQFRDFLSILVAPQEDWGGGGGDSSPARHR